MSNLPEEEVITDDDRLLRRVIYTDPNYIREDGTVTSFAFSLRRGEDGLSVDIERLTTYEDAIQDRFKYRLYAVRASVPRELGLECVHDPIDTNYAHALIKGNFTKRISRKLAKNAKRVIEDEE